MGKLASLDLVTRLRFTTSKSRSEPAVLHLSVLVGSGVSAPSRYRRAPHFNIYAPESHEKELFEGNDLVALQNDVASQEALVEHWQTPPPRSGTATNPPLDKSIHLDNVSWFLVQSEEQNFEKLAGRSAPIGPMLGMLGCPTDEMTHLALSVISTNSCRARKKQNPSDATRCHHSAFSHVLRFWAGHRACPRARG